MASPVPSAVFPSPEIENPTRFSAEPVDDSADAAPEDPKKKRRRRRRRPQAKKPKGGIKNASKKIGMAKRVAKGFGRIGVPGLLAGTALSALAFPIMERLIYGSREDQMRDQFDMQRKLEQEEMARMGGMGGMGGMASGPVDDRSLYQLVSDEGAASQDVGFANRRNNLMASLNRPSGSAELERLLAGEETRIRSAMAPRQLTPYEVMAMLDG